MNTFIYSLSHPETGEVKYIGKSNDPKARLKSHLCLRKKDCYTKTRNWINSLKENNLIPAMDIIDEVKYEDWEFWERHYISLYKSWNFKLTNHQIGGGFNKDFVKATYETRLKMSKAQLGKKASAETKEKLSQAKRGIKLSEEQKEYLRKLNTGKKMSPEAIAKTVAAKEKPVLQFDYITGEFIAEHKSLRAAKTAVGDKSNNMSSHLKGKRKYCKGFRWEYKNKE